MASSHANAKSYSLPAFGTVEDNPHDKIVREALEAVLDVRRHEQDVSWAEGMALGSVDERPGSAYDHVQFVAGVWSLWICAAGSVDLHLHAPVPKHLREPLSSGSGQPPYRV